MATRNLVSMVLVFAAVALAGCSNTRVSALLDQEKQSIRSHWAQKIGASPTEVERAFDESAASEILTAREISSRVEKRYGVSEDVAMQAKLQAMAERLAEPVADINGEMDVVLLADGEINAFTPGGGKILIKEGLVALCDTEAQMAAVLAHEIAHIAMRHPRRLKQVSLFRRAGDKFVDSIIPESMREGVTEKVLRSSGRATLNIYVRNQEYQADAAGIDLLVRAGYDPKAMVDLQRNLHRQVKQMPRLLNVIYGNHPLSEDRAAEAQRRIDRHYADVSGVRSTRAYDKLARKYIARRAQVLAQK